MNYKEEIEQLEKDCTIGFDDAFNYHLLVDVEENGGVKELFTDEDLYCFWLEKGYRINFILEDLLYSSEKKDLALKAIHVKRIIDTNLLKYGKSKKEILEDLALQEIKEHSETIEIKFQGENKEKFLNAFYKQLVEDEFIDCTFEIFSSNFLSSKNSQRINWIGKQKDLLGLIKSLHKIFILKKRTHTNLILDHFLINGKELKRGSVESTLPNSDLKEIMSRKYLEIVSKFLI